MLKRNGKSGRFIPNGEKKYHKGYPIVYKPEHPRSRANGYVYEHIIKELNEMYDYLTDNLRARNADLAAMKRERDAAVKDLETLMRDGYECDCCAYGLDEDCGYHDGLKESCNPKWRGVQAPDGAEREGEQDATD